MSRLRRRCVLLLVLAASLLAWPQQDESQEEAPPPDEQREVIRSFDSRIELRREGTMRVTETIRVLALNESINHGIYRDFPTRYRDRFGERYNVKFEVAGARRDGNSEPWHTESLENGVRVYLGSKDVIVPQGEHTYEITYETDRQAGYFPDHDELYWNVTGNGWVFPIERATAEVTLPSGVPRSEIKVEGYTGPQGSTAREYAAEVDENGVAHFATTRALDAYEGLTIVVSFPKGLLVEPTREERVRWFLEDNKAALVALIGLVIALVYQFFAWSAVGRDPAPGTIVVRYEPPAGFSPGAIRYLRRMQYDDKIFAAMLVDMAVKRYLRIDQNDDGEFTLTLEPERDRSLLTEEEKTLADSLFQGSIDLPPGPASVLEALQHPEEPASGDQLYVPPRATGALLGETASVELRQKNHTRIKEAIDAVKEQLARQMEQRYFLRNGKYLWPSVAVTLVTFVAVVASAEGEELGVAIFMTVWLSFWSLGVSALSVAVAAAWRKAWHSHGWGKLSYGGALFITAFAVPFFAGELAGLGMFAKSTSIAATLILILLAISNFIFHELLKAPTHAGRDLLDQIDGFREFVGATEDMERKYPLDRSPGTFEKILPYAMAMDMEEVWTSKFQSVLAAAVGGGAAATVYSPAWMNLNSGSGFSGLSSLGDLGGSLSSAISSSSTAPGSSSGGGGGGSSGGGGGGGGGGGW